MQYNKFIEFDRDIDNLYDQKNTKKHWNYFIRGLLPYLNKSLTITIL